MSVANSWLPSLVASEKFFTPCSKCSDHHSSRESTLNFWDIERQEELCSICLHDYPRENVLQVRRSSYHDVIKVADMVKLADIANIQAYVINGSKVVFLRRRPQPRPPKGAVGASQCILCARHLQDVSLYCSVQCKMDYEFGHVKVLDSSNSSGRGPETPHMQIGSRFPHYSSGSDSDFMGESCICVTRRKGMPRRSPAL